MTDEQTPAAGPLTAESARLLQPGDWLLHKDGTVHRILSAIEGWVFVADWREPIRAFAFLGRPDQDGWIAWHGGENPVPGVRVEVRLRSGDEFTGSDVNAEGTWRHIWGEGDITHYRPHLASPTSSSSVVQGDASGVERDVQGLVRPDAMAGRRWRHKARGTTYTSLGFGKAQCSPSGLLDDENVVIYQGDDGSLWARRHAEFSDGRFEEITALRPQPSGETRRISVDDLAQEIRRVDGNHSLGAGALAEALMPFLIRPAAPDAGGGFNSTHRHVKRGTTYQVLGEARLQQASQFGPVEGDSITFYRGEDGQLWARATSEFEDGRFSALQPGGER